MQKISNIPDSKNETLQRNRGIIVGFDPGLTAGIAIMDLKGNILSVKSFKEISRAEIIYHIINYGKTVLVSTDVYPPPKMVKKLATALNAKIHHPTRDMSVGSKIEMVESYLSEKSSLERSKVVSSELVPQDAHQRDALAASIRTYKSYHKKLDQIESRSLEINLSSEDEDLVKRMVIGGTAISSAIRLVQEMHEEADETDITGDPEEIIDTNPNVDFETVSKLKNRIRIQENQINNLKSKNSSLEDRIKDYGIDVVRLKEKMSKLQYEYTQNILLDKELHSKISLIKKLQEKYAQEKALRIELEENLNSLRNIQRIKPTENAIPVKIIESFTKDGIMAACEYWKIKRGDVVLLESSEGGGSQTAALLINMGVKAVLIRDKISHRALEEFEKNMVPLLQADNMELKMIDQFAIVNSRKLEELIHRWKEEMEDKRIKEINQVILKAFDEYRARRKRLN